MPGGLKENVEFYLGKALRIDKSEGTGVVYKALKEFAEQHERCYPDVFDVLNCQEGCNLGTGCIHERNIFEINTVMDHARRDVVEGRDKEEFDAIFEEYDNTLDLDRFIRRYSPMSARNYNVNRNQIEEGFKILGKTIERDKKFDCSACGADSCHDMARQIALGLNVPENCIQKVRNDVHREHEAVLESTTSNISNIHDILADISKIKELSDEINQSVTGINSAIAEFSDMSKNIDKIAMQINLIALNASIEAARAGDFGKAFSVVAEEIRRLANSSKETVEQTEEVISHATGSIEGVNIMVSQISTEVEKAYKNISEISDKTQKSLGKK
jgi:methyl-accepting chemotaxis protein